MVPNLEWCKQNFTAFNAQYFGGKLPMPKFSYNCPKNTWGIYNCDAEYDNNGKITNIYNSGEMAFTKLYDRNEKSIQNTLLHEMIHMYCALVLRIVPKHDGNFEQLATKMRQDGWDISEINGKTDEDVLINGQDVPDMENNQGDNYVGGNQFFDTAQKMFGELQQLKVRLNNLQQAKAKMNECKKVIISEEQEKALIDILKGEKHGGKTYPIDPTKVLLVKKHLDNNFKKFNYATLKGGRKNNVMIVGLMDGDNVLKYMYKEDLKDYLIDYFSKMFSDEVERDLFMSAVIDRWLMNKIGVHGTLDINFLK